MDLRYRPMRPEDVVRCAHIIEAHPVIGPRYGTAIADLRKAWRRLLDSEAKVTGVIEDADQLDAGICFVGVAVFVSDDFVRELKTPPLRWFGPELAKRIVRGESLLLSDRQLAEANSRGGLNTITWEACIPPQFEKRLEIYNRMMSTFVELHRGYRWNEAIAPQLESARRLQWTLQNGGLLWDPARGCYVDSLGKDPQEIVREPHLVGITRDINCARPGSWVGTIFDYHPPQIGFSRGEQHLLVLALSGKTDEELSTRLGVSLSTIKNTWRTVYNRAASRLPELFPEAPTSNALICPRGKEKRRRLLGYVREHPEELRPVSRRLLQKIPRLEEDVL